MKTWQKYAAEFYGTFVLVGVGFGAILGINAMLEGFVSGFGVGIGGALSGSPEMAEAGLTAAVLGGGAEGKIITIAMAFGIGLMVALYTVGRISGGHFNPAVSLAMFFDRRIGLTDMFGYWVAQIGGAILAALAYLWIINQEAVALTATKLNETYVGTFGGFVGEAILTAIFVFAVLVLSKSQAHTKFLGIGFALAAVHFVGIAFTGASVNPARSFAPALIGATWDGYFWIYIAGPLLGAIVGWVLYKVISEGDTDFKDDLSEIKDAATT